MRLRSEMSRSFKGENNKVRTWQFPRQLPRRFRNEVWTATIMPLADTAKPRIPNLNATPRSRGADGARVVAQTTLEK